MEVRVSRCTNVNRLNVFVSKDLPDKILEVSQPCSEKSIWLPKLMVAHDIAKSTGEARRLIKQGGVYLNGKRIDDENYELKASEPAEYILKVGKRRFLKILIC